MARNRPTLPGFLDWTVSSSSSVQGDFRRFDAEAWLNDRSDLGNPLRGAASQVHRESTEIAVEFAPAPSLIFQILKLKSRTSTTAYTTVHHNRTSPVKGGLD